MTIRKLVLLAVLFAVTLSAEQCGPNEEFMSCGTACEPKCNEPVQDFCTLQCIVNVCQCKRGFKRGPNGCVAPGPGCE
ncbi:trypsin Inhibitor like cysteine rich domain protein [Teladorsagia circumcincta]|uniref:Trypsin Inhibitor like cysteine rich domain protein n=1 Tax=Teladorsagia circumcincta TaxID=45464 RepID=A0A2G9TRI0_TELCI|nr:trypsin Inhibitor like cysteine rich domain protein [Teladorsagia circumcincta]